MWTSGWAAFLGAASAIVPAASAQTRSSGDLLDRPARFDVQLIPLERALTERLQVSRTPIREAIKRLEQEGLVVCYPHRGCFVRNPSYDEAREAYEMRRVAEGVAGELASSFWIQNKPQSTATGSRLFYSNTLGAIYFDTADVFGSDRTCGRRSIARIGSRAATARRPCTAPATE